jgi:hypothetical protein
MKTPHRIALSIFLFIACAAPVMAQRGWVYVVNRTQTAADEWIYDPQWSYAIGSGAFELIYHPVPYSVEGPFLVPAPRHYVFHYERTVSMWDGVQRYFTEPGKGYDEIFTSDTELSEIAPMGGGRFLVAERWNTRERGAHLIAFDANGRITEYRLPELIDDANRAVGAMHLELLADRCTLLYTTGAEHFAGNRVQRMNLCTRTAMPDFAVLPRDSYAGAIRQLPNGEVLVANGDAVLHFTAAGTLMRSYEVSRVTHIALSPDAKSFWAAGVHDHEGILRRYDLAMPYSVNPAVPLGNPQRKSSETPEATTALVVIGEWRAAYGGRKLRASGN